MKELNLSTIDLIRKKGFRPQVIGCFLHQKKILFVYRKKYKLWLFPQGGIDNRETILQAAAREMAEELNPKLVNSSKIIKIFGKDKVEFTKDKWGDRELKTDQGQEILMKGKVYFFVAFKALENKVDLTKTEFDDYKWVNYSESLELSKKIYQPGKLRITKKILTLLNQEGLI